MAPTESTTPSTNKKNSAGKAKRKKQRISKHVILARESKAKQDQQEDISSTLPVEALTVAGAIVPNKPAADKKQKKKKTKKHVKDPNEVMAYLSGWKYRAVEGSVWKFNKNTQSWLIRHMYEPEKVSKDMFTLLIEYLTGLEGVTRQRVVSDAATRALRYKEYESKNAEQQPNGDEASKTQTESETNDLTKSIEDGAKAQTSDADAAEENDRWNKSSDHEKRKEYKRARKVLDTLKEKKEDDKLA